MTKITPEHIVSATGKQLAQLFGVHENTIVLWTSERADMSGRNLSHGAGYAGITKDVLVLGLDLRRKRAKEIQQQRQELQELLNAAKEEESKQLLVTA